MALDRESSTGYFHEINLFRGFAIFCIVWGHITMTMHLFGKANLAGSWSILDKIRVVLTLGNTAFFVFISGFLFYKIFYIRGFDFDRFVSGKFRKVLLPWLFTVLVFSVLRTLVQPPQSVNSSYIIYQCIFYWSFWYVPFVMVLFLMSSLYTKFIELTERQKCLIFVLSVALSMCIGRHNTNPLLSVLFWNSFYLFGLICALKYERIVNMSREERQVLYSLTVLLIGIVVAIPKMEAFSGYGTYDLRFFQKIELLVPLKMMLCVVFMHLFGAVYRRNGSILRSALEVLAKYSFPIFFLHQFFIFYFEINGFWFLLSDMKWWKLQLLAILISSAICFICISVAFLIKRLTGKYSRMVIGV